MQILKGLKLSKKLIVLLSLLGAIIVTMLILFWTLFGLSSATVQFHSTTKNLNLSQEQIVKQAKFRYGSCVLFEGKKKPLSRLEDATENENFAYLKVLNIETVFPNKYVIHVAEREELFKVEIGGQAYICDHEFRILNYADESDELIAINGLEILQENVKIGDFLQIKQQNLKKFYGAMLQNNRDLSQILGKFQSIDLSTYTELDKEFVSMKLTTKEGSAFLIKNIDFALANKIALMFAVESSLYGQIGSDGFLIDADGQTLYFKQNELGGLESCQEAEGQPLQASELKNYTICVDNLTFNEFKKLSEKDICWSLLKNE